MPKLSSADLRARDFQERDILALALAFCNHARNQPFGARLESGEYVETDSYALASAIENLRQKNQALADALTSS